tara:strand:- start:850 stop:963 length:114 start_codon:yes stop_codon:yes gene_type:complete
MPTMHLLWRIKIGMATGKQELMEIGLETTLFPFYALY